MKRRRNKSAGVSFFAFQDIITSVVGIFVLITLIMVLELAQTVSEARAASAPRVSSELLASLEFLDEDVRQLQAQYEKLSAGAETAASTNRFNRADQLQEIESQLQQLADHITRANQITQETQQSLIDAQEVTEQMIADAKAAESDRHELQDMQDRRREVQRYSSVLEIDRPLIFRDTTQENRWLVLILLVGDAIQISDATDGSSQEFSGGGRLADFERWLSSKDLSTRHLLLIVKPRGAADFPDIRTLLDSKAARYGYDVAPEEANYLLRSEIEVGT